MQRSLDNHGLLWLLALLLPTMPVAAEVEVAALHGFSFGAGEVSFTITSNGCTQIKDFELLIEPQSQRLTVIRLRKDMCRRRPFAQKISLPVTEPLPQLRVSNPFVSAPAQAYPFPRPKGQGRDVEVPQ